MNAPGGSITVRVRAIGGLVFLWANPSVADKDAAAGSSNSAAVGRRQFGGARPAASGHPRKRRCGAPPIDGCSCCRAQI